MTDTTRLREVFLHEYEATGRNLDAALKAVAVAVKAQLDLPFERRRRPLDVSRQVVLDKYERVAASQVIVEAAREFNVDPEHMRCSWARRSVPHRKARWVAWRVLHEAPFELSLPECAQALGVRNHTSVLEALRKLDKDPGLLAAATRVRQRMGLWIAPVHSDCQQAAMTAEKASNAQANAIATQRSPAVSTLAREEAA